MKKILYILIALTIGMIIFFGIRFLIGGDEDTWICKDGRWVKHGNPSAGPPNGECGR